MSVTLYTVFPKSVTTFSQLAAIAQRRFQQYGDPTLSDLVSEAALLQLEEKISFTDAWNRVRSNSKTAAPEKNTCNLHIFIDQDDALTGRHPVHMPLELQVRDEYAALANHLQDPGWLELLVAKIEPMQRFAVNGTERAAARRAIKILEILCERIEAEEYSAEDGKSFVFEPRLTLYQYVAEKLRAQGDPISIDHLKHTFLWLRKMLEPIAKQCKIETRETRGKK